MSSQLYKVSLLIILLILNKIINFAFNNTIIYFTNHKKNEGTFLHSKDNIKEIQEFVDIIFNGTLIDKNEIFSRTNSPKISVIITINNGEAFLKTCLLSVQNQDLKDIEILMIDDASKDNSINLIRELMVKDERIILIQNEENKGTLYTKVKGISMAKGKYILLLDEDDIYCQRDAFSTLYNEAEKNKLDILKFRKIKSKPKINNNFFLKNENKTYQTIFQPELSKILFRYNRKGRIIYTHGFISDLFIKRNILLKIIKEIDEKYLNDKMNFHEDTLIYFLLSRNAYNFKIINRIFYIVIKGWNKTNKKVKFRFDEKFRNKKYNRCNSNLNFIEFVLNKTKNNFSDKQFAFYSLNRWYLNIWCRKNNQTFKKAIKISKEFLGCKYITNSSKKKIKII